MTSPASVRTVDGMGPAHTITTWPPPVVPRSHTAVSSWTAWTLATLASIWIAVALISVLAPDLIHGSEHQRLPVAALVTWMWGFGASIAVLGAMSRARGRLRQRPLWVALFVATVLSWSASAVISITAPTYDTGSDPTTIPLAAVVSPLLAMLATTGAAVVVLVAATRR
jgi:hypothetical protein